MSRLPSGTQRPRIAEDVVHGFRVTFPLDPTLGEIVQWWKAILAWLVVEISLGCLTFWVLDQRPLWGDPLVSGLFLTAILTIPGMISRLDRSCRWTPNRSDPRRPIIDLPRAGAVPNAEGLSPERNPQPAIRSIRRHLSVLRRRAGGRPYCLRLPQHDRSLWAWCDRNGIAHRHNSHQREIQNRGRCGTCVFGRITVKRTAIPF